MSVTNAKQFHVQALFTGIIPLWETVLLVLLHNTSRPTVSQFLLYLVIPPFGLQLGALGCPSDTNVYDSI